MTRSPREIKTAPGIVSHVIARGNNRMTIFRTAADLYWFCDRLRELKKEYGVDLYAFCLMSNHFHLLVRQAEKALGEFMKSLQQGFAIRFNALYSHTGHVFQDRFYSKPCMDDRYFMTLLRYIARNPVEAGMVKLAGDWKFSGHRELIGQPGLRLVDTAFPLAVFNDDVDAARAAYSAMVNNEPIRPPWQSVILEKFAKEGFVLEDMLGRKRGLATDVRYEAILAALEEGATPGELCRFLDVSYMTVSRARASEKDALQPVRLWADPSDEPVAR